MKRSFPEADPNGVLVSGKAQTEQERPEQENKLKGIVEEALELKDRLVKIRRELHGCPETGIDLKRTLAVVHRELPAGCAVEEPCPGGLLCTIRGGKPGKTILLRADMDALPMHEESGLDFAARGPAAHTCGHDMHTTMLLGAAELLVRRRENLSGTVKLAFQPAEETMTGAAAMIAAGILENPRVDAALAMHVAPGRPVGRFNCSGGCKMASSDRFIITVEGVGGHGAMPDKCVDPIAAAVQIHLALQTIISRECPSGAGSVLTIGSFHSGTAGNILPSSAVMEGTTRSGSREQRDFIIRRIGEYTMSIAAAHRAAGRFEVPASIPPLYNNIPLAAEVARILRANLGEEAVDESRDYQPVSEDFALIAERVPSVYLTLGTGLPEDGYLYGNHHPRVKYPEEILPLGSAAFCACAMDCV
jgi:amidohydrolase